MPALTELPAPRKGAREGFYADPLGGRFVRWWDGQRWTHRLGPRKPPDLASNWAMSPPTKVCRHCAAQSETFSPDCPVCGKSYSTPAVWKIVLISVAAGLLLIGGCGGFVLFGVDRVHNELQKDAITTAEFESVPPDATRLEIENRFGDPVDRYRRRGTPCIDYYRAGQGLLGFDFYEFCFLRGKLIRKGDR